MRDLPHDLVAAFQATLQEAVKQTAHTCLSIAIIPEMDEHILEVKSVLEQIGVDEIPVVEVLTK